MTSTIRPAGDFDAVPQTVTVEDVTDYHAGAAALAAQTPDGWQQIHISVDRD